MRFNFKRALSGFMLFAIVLGVFAAAAEPVSAKVISGYTSKVDYENTDPGRYKIDIDLVNQVITVYEKGESGAYDKIVLQGLCTTGNEENPTGAGTFKLGHLKERFGYFVAFGQYAQYWTQVVRGVYIHSVMYDKKSLTTMSKSAYNNLGKAMSHGCVRVLPEHAKWIFYNCPPSTVCVIARKRAENPELVKKLKAEKPSYSDYVQPKDFKPDPPIVPAMVRVATAPLRTGFSTAKDTTVLTLKSGEVVKALQIGPDWCKVETAKGKLGYVQTQYLQMNPDTLISAHGDYYAKDTTYLYSSQSVNAKRLHTYAKGDAIDVMGSADIYWLTAKVGDTYGFVRAKYTTSENKTALPDEVLFEERVTRIKPNIIANVRSGPGTSYPVIMELMAGTTITLVENHGNWYMMTVDGKEGFISAICVE